MSAHVFEGKDAEQVKLMQEMCIVINEKDEMIGEGSKKDCHLNENIKDGLLHRAFSVFLFNTKGELLLQQRAPNKITYPEYWTNTCCSHPLAKVDPANTEDGVVEDETTDAYQLGVRRAARRKLWHELRVPGKKICLSNFHYLQRVHYESMAGSADKVWGEHEIDYILFLVADVAHDAVENEVMATRYVTQSELKVLLAEAAQKGTKITPWFKLICDTHLFAWWDALMEGRIQQYQTGEIIPKKKID